MTRYCCCMSLRTAGITVGYIGVIILMLSATRTIRRFNVDTDSEQIDPSKYDAEREYKLYVRSNTTLGAYLIGALLGIIPYIMLIYGATKRKHLWLLPFLVVKGIYLVILLLLILYVSIFFIQVPKYLWVVALFLLFNAFLFYVWYVVLMLYKELKKNKQQQALGTTITKDIVTPYEIYKV